MTSVFAMIHLPPIEAFPEIIRNKNVVCIKTVFVGDEQESEELLASYKALNPVYVKQETTSYEIASQIDNGPEAPEHVHGHMEILNEFSPQLTKLITDLVAAHPQIKPVIEIRHVGGAMASVQASSNAFGHRDGQYILQVEIVLDENITEHLAVDFLKQFSISVKPYVTGGTYLNFIGNVEVEDDRIKAAFDEEDYLKLQQLKDIYDPRNKLRFNHNIPPSNSN